MKRPLVIIALLVVLLSLFAGGCNDNSTSDDPGSSCTKWVTHCSKYLTCTDGEYTVFEHSSCPVGYHVADIAETCWQECVD